MIIDRIEGDVAVCEQEDGSHVNIPRSCLPGDVREGSVLAWTGSAWALDLQEESERRKRLFSKQEGLFQ